MLLGLAVYVGVALPDKPVPSKRPFTVISSPACLTLTFCIRPSLCVQSTPWTRTAYPLSLILNMTTLLVLNPPDRLHRVLLGNVSHTIVSFGNVPNFISYVALEGKYALPLS